MNPYEELGVCRDADTDAVNAAYRKAARQYHPDAGGDRDAFERVQQAAMILRDPERRAKFDATGETDTSPDNETSAIASIIVEAFDTAMAAAPDYRAADIVAHMTKHINAAMRSLADQKKHYAAGLSEIDAASERLEFRGAGTDFIAANLRLRRGQIEQAITECERQVGLREKALEITKGYRWRFEKTEQPDLRNALFRVETTTGTTGGWR